MTALDQSRGVDMSGTRGQNVNTFTTNQSRRNQTSRHRLLDPECDSTYGSIAPRYGYASSETTSISSDIYRGFVQNGRRYAGNLSSNQQYFSPCDDQQFKSIELIHIMYTVMESHEKNPLFKSPIRPDAKYIIDLGCGDGSWAIAHVADQNPQLTVFGVDLASPPKSWVPPNCLLELDDITKPWTWPMKFDLVHIRLLLGSFQEEGWETSSQAAGSSKPRQTWKTTSAATTAPCPPPPSSQTGVQLSTCAENAWTPLDICRRMKAKIEAAGFINVQEKKYKIPVGDWCTHPTHKDAGNTAVRSFKEGVEGWAMLFLTRHAEPKWTTQKVKTYVRELGKELDRRWHLYIMPRRVWAQKPYDTPDGLAPRPVVAVEA